MVKGICDDRHGPLPSLLPSPDKSFVWRARWRNLRGDNSCDTIVNRHLGYRTQDQRSSLHSTQPQQGAEYSLPLLTASPSWARAVRRASAVPEGITAPLSPHDPPTRAASDRALGGDHHLRNGAARRVSPALSTDTALRGLGSGRDRSLDRKPQASLAISRGRHIVRPGREAASAPPCSMRPPSGVNGDYPASTLTSSAPGSTCAM